MNTLKEVDILDRSKLALSSLFQGMVVNDQLLQNGKAAGIDGRLSLDKTKFDFVIMNSPSIGRIKNTFHKFQQLNSNNPLLFIIDHASEETKQFFRKENLFFIDAAGNTYINLPQLRLSVEGKVFDQSFNTKRAFQKTGLKIIFHLLMQPTLVQQSIRKIAKEAASSVAAVSYVLEELEEDGFIVNAGKSKKQFIQIESLIKQWALAYIKNLRPKIHRGYFIPLQPEQFSGAGMIQQNLPYSGEYRAEYLTWLRNPKRLIIYTDLRISELSTQYGLLPINKLDGQENIVEVLAPFWENEVEQANEFPYMPHILVYADLLTSKDYRSHEAAENILHHNIKDEMTKNGFQW